MNYTEKNMIPLFNLLEKLNGVDNNTLYHPEGCVLQHTLQVLQFAFKESRDADLILAAMLHDVGKSSQFLNHAEIGAELINPYCSPKTVWLVENHMRMHLYLDGRMKKPGKCIALASHRYFPELVQLSRWDMAGRVKGTQLPFNKASIVNQLNNIIRSHNE